MSIVISRFVCSQVFVLSVQFFSVPAWSCFLFYLKNKSSCNSASCHHQRLHMGPLFTSPRAATVTLYKKIYHPRIVTFPHISKYALNHLINGHSPQIFIVYREKLKSEVRPQWIKVRYFKKKEKTPAKPCSERFLFLSFLF